MYGDGLFKVHCWTIGPLLRKKSPYIHRCFIAKTTETYSFITNRRVDLFTCCILFFDNCLAEVPWTVTRPRIPICVFMCVCMSVLCGIDLSVYWSDCHVTLATVHCYGLVVHHPKYFMAPFVFLGGGYKIFPLTITDGEVPSVSPVDILSHVICTQESTLSGNRPSMRPDRMSRSGRQV